MTPAAPSSGTAAKAAAQPAIIVPPRAGQAAFSPWGWSPSPVQSFLNLLDYGYSLADAMALTVDLLVAWTVPAYPGAYLE